MSDTGSALLDEILAERDRIRKALYAPRRMISPRKDKFQIFTRVEPSLEKRKAEALKLRGTISEGKLHTMLNAINGSERDFRKYSAEIPKTSITITQIQTAVCEHFNLTREEMLSEKRIKLIIVPRQISMYLSKVLTTRSLSHIGRLFGNRDHTIVIHAIKKIEKRIVTNQEFANEIKILKDMLKV